MKRFAIALTLFAAWSGIAQADNAEAGRTIHIAGRDRVTVTQPRISLSDVAEVSSPDPADDDALIALKQIYIADSPAPGARIDLTALSILDQLSAQGVKLDSLRYTFPKLIAVRRAARAVSLEEIENAIRSYLEQGSERGELRSVTYSGAAKVAPGALEISAVPLGPVQRSQQKFALRLSVDGMSAGRIEVTAQIDQWTDVPVIKSGIARGQVVRADDVMMARMNMDAIPRDALTDMSGIVGLEAKKPISAGEVLRREKLEVPMVIRAGERVTLRYRSGLLEATASGVAIDGAAAQGTIRVRNEASKKIVVGTAIEAGLVEVMP